MENELYSVAFSKVWALNPVAFVHHLLLYFSTAWPEYEFLVRGSAR
jgi:hypothetical protein